MALTGSRASMAAESNSLVTAAVSSDGTYPRTASEIAANVAPLNESYPPGHLLRYGADPTGAIDASNAFRLALSCNPNVDARNGRWKISSTISIPSLRVIDLRGAVINADCGSTPIFSSIGAKEGLTILGGGGVVVGTAKSFLYCEGLSFQPTSLAQYARQIRLDGLYVASATIQWFLDFQKAVRQVFVDSCMSYTPNGVNADGKHVEIYFQKTMLYSATKAPGTSGVRLRSSGGGRYYNEGWELTDCLVDQFEKSLDVTDIFYLGVTSGFIGCSPTGYAAWFGDPVTDSGCHDIKFTGVGFCGRVKFEPQGGCDYAATFVGCTSMSCTGANIEAGNNASGITIRSHKFKSSASGIAIVFDSNNSNCIVDGIDCDVTFIAGVQVKGAIGANVLVSGISYAGTGEPLIANRAVVARGIPVATPYSAALRQVFNPASIQGTHKVGSIIASIVTRFAKGETGSIVIELGCSGMSAAERVQRFEINVPAGVVIPSGTGWSARYMYPMIAAGRISLKIPYYCTVDEPNGTISIVNAAGNPVKIEYHSFFGIVRDL
jgi:hypothetical protein